MKIVKLSGAGNDFIALGPEEAATLGEGLARWVRRVCRRGLSVGADGVLVIEPVGVDRVVARFHNPDGGEAFCANGIRCAARFASLRGWAREVVTLETPIGEIHARIREDQVRITLPGPKDRGMRTVETNLGVFEGRAIDAGVPHFVIVVADVAATPLDRWGPVLRSHPDFGTEGTNVNIATLATRGPIAVRTWERGVEGETLACGTGALAVALAAHLDGGPAQVGVMPASGIPLRVSLAGGGDSPGSALLEGDARVVLEGELSREAIEDPGP